MSFYKKKNSSFGNYRDPCRTEKLSIEQNKLWHIMIYHNISWLFFHKSWYIMKYHDISWHFVIKIKTSFCCGNEQLWHFLSWKFMIPRLLIAFEDLLGSSIAPQVMPHWHKAHLAYNRPLCSQQLGKSRLILAHSILLSIYSIIDQYQQAWVWSESAGRSDPPLGRLHVPGGASQSSGESTYRLHFLSCNSLSYWLGRA